MNQIESSIEEALFFASSCEGINNTQNGAA